MQIFDRPHRTLISEFYPPSGEESGQGILLTNQVGAKTNDSISHIDSLTDAGHAVYACEMPNTTSLRTKGPLTITQYLESARHVANTLAIDAEFNSMVANADQVTAAGVFSGGLHAAAVIANSGPHDLGIDRLLTFDMPAMQVTNFKEGVLKYADSALAPSEAYPEISIDQSPQCKKSKAVARALRAATDLTNMIDVYKSCVGADSLNTILENNTTDNQIEAIAFFGYKSRMLSGDRKDQLVNADNNSIQVENLQTIDFHSHGDIKKNFAWLLDLQLRQPTL